MDRLQEDWQHQYRATPLEYPISNNEAHSTYDQFIQLRDTLIMSNKYYADSAWRSLIIWTKLNGDPTGTIEIWKPNICKLSFEPGRENDISKIDFSDVHWEYITVPSSHSNIKLSCDIQKDWRYVLQHKEQLINIPSSITRVTAYIMQHKRVVTIVGDEEVVSYQSIPRAVFDWSWSEQGLFDRMTSFGYVECDLAKWDWCELIIEDQRQEPISSDYIQPNSNWFSVEYKDLAYKL